MDPAGRIGRFPTGLNRHGRFDDYVRVSLERDVRRLPAWARTLRSRARLDPAALTEFGHLLETFVVGEIIKQVA